MRKEYLLTSFNADSVGTQCLTISYTLVFNEQAQMVVEEHRDFNQPFNQNSVTAITPEAFDKYTVNGLPLRQLVLKKLQEILPISN